MARLTAQEHENKLFRDIVEHAGDIVITVHDFDDQGRILYANEAACRHFGVDRATLETWKLHDFDAHINDDFFVELKARLSSGHPHTFESEHRVAGGQLAPVNVVMRPLEQEGRMLCVGYTHDIRERMMAKAQRRYDETTINRQEMDERFRSLVDALPDSIVCLDTKARHVYVSPQLLRQTGRNEAEFLGKTVLESGITGSRDSDQQLYEAAMRVVESGEANVHRYWGVLPDRKVCFEIRHVPEKDDTGKVVSVLGIWRDITERTRIEDTLQFIAQRGWSSDSEPFHVALARYLGTILDVDYVLVDRLTSNADEVETVALYARGEILPNMYYGLKGTPCENVINGRLCCYKDNVQQLFPEDQLLAKLKVESYIGIPLWNSAGEALGLIAIMDGKPIVDEGTATGLLQLIASSTAAELERERWEQALKTREREHRRLLDNSPDIIIRFDTECRRTYCNPAHAKRMDKPVSLGTTPLEDWGLPTDIAVVEDYQAHLLKILDTAEPDEWELDFEVNGNRSCYLVSGTPEFDQEGKVAGVLVFSRDITARKQLEAATIALEQEFRTLVENSPDFVTRFDTNCRRTYANPILDAAMGAKSIMGKTPSESYPGNKEALEYEQLIRRVLESGADGQCMLNFIGNDGHQYCLDIRVVPELDADGKIIGVMAIGRDISQRLHLEEELRRQANYDALTGLPNRWLFSDRLHEEIVRAGRDGSNVALLFIDLDRFKEINDTLGHEFGDQLLLEAAERIQSCVRQSDTIARLGGDEFVAILPGVTDLAHLGSVAQKIIDTMTRSFDISGHSVYVTASLGIASYPMDADNAKTLLCCADQAMYIAKERGRNGFSFFTASMQALAEQRLSMANDLRRAMPQQQFQLHYQPIIDTATGKVAKAEALLRWYHPKQGLVPPDQFIPIAEETGIIHELGNWVFQEAAKLAVLWREQCHNECFQVSINISPRQFLQPLSVDVWLGYLADLKLPAECITIEITESLLLGDRRSIIEKLKKLREAGIQTALDDFGTGYSAIAYLKKFNIDYLKIDRSFVRDLTVDENDRAIAETIVMMANRLGLKTIAEGVETTDQRDILAAVGCEYLQGYLYAKPMPADEFLEYVAGNEHELKGRPLSKKGS